jgi:hypothetical protein
MGELAKDDHQVAPAAANLTTEMIAAAWVPTRSAAEDVATIHG